jgi:hypothetical protein
METVARRAANAMCRKTASGGSLNTVILRGQVWEFGSVPEPHDFGAAGLSFLLVRDWSSVKEEYSRVSWGTLQGADNTQTDGIRVKIGFDKRASDCQVAFTSRICCVSPRA